MIYDKGKYRVRIKSAGLGESAEKKTPVIVFKVDILGRYERDSTGGEELFQCDPGIRTINVYITEKTMEFVPDKLRAAGWDGDDFNAIQEMEGLECDATCAHEPGVGDNATKMFEKWDLGAPTFKPVEHDEGVAKRLNALFGKSLKAAKPKEKAAVSAVPDKMSDRDDDVPF